MFTGLVQTVGEWLGLFPRPPSGARLAVRAALPGPPLAIGESIAVNGVCLTLVEAAGNRLVFDVLDETLARTAFREKAPGARVNLERALRAGDALGGHFVTGHVDAPGRLLRVEEGRGDRVLWIEVPDPALFRWLLPKGSVAIDGTSLTLVDVLPAESRFSVHVIPHTWATNALAFLRPGAAVNLEADLLAKAARNAIDALPSPPPPPPVTWERLRSAGFC